MRKALQRYEDAIKDIFTAIEGTVMVIKYEGTPYVLSRSSSGDIVCNRIKEESYEVLSEVLGDE